MLEKILRGYGQKIIRIHGGERFEIWGFLQPVTGKAEGFAGMEAGALGLVCQNRVVYIGPAEPELRIGDLLEAGTKIYRVRRAQVAFQGERPLYCWAMCTEKGGEDTWGSDG